MCVDKNLLCLAFVAWALPATAGQPAVGQPGVLSGRVLDETGAGIAGATVVAAGATTGGRGETVADDSGGYRLPDLRPDRYRITVQAPGFEQASHDGVVLAGDQPVTLDLTLQVAGFTQEVQVTGNTAPVVAASSQIELKPVEVRSVAGAGENIFRVLQTLPGVTATSDFSSRLAVRGGGPDQNLTMMDGVEIHNPYRLFGLTSAFNPEVVENFELTAGAFNAKYGDRLSSILVVDNRAGRSRSLFSGSANLSATDGNVVAEGRLPGTATGSWLVTGRRTYYDVIAERFVNTSLPSFSDLQAKTTWASRAGRRVTLFGLLSREGTNAEVTEEDIGTDALKGEAFALRAGTRNDLAGAAFSSPLGQRGSSTTTVSWYRNRERLAFDANVKDEARRSNRPEPDAVMLSNFGLTRNIEIRDVAIRQDTQWQAGAAHLLEFGFDAHSLRTGWASQILGARNTDAANGSSAIGGAGLPSLLDSTRSTWRAGAWLTDKWAITPRLRTELGMRLDRSGIAGEMRVSPRLAAVVDVGGGFRLRAAGGMFTQSPGYEKLLQSDYFVDLSNASAAGLRSERATHGLLALERRVPGGLVTRIEAYYKRFDDLLLGSLETPEANAARIAGYSFPAELTWSIPTAPLITSMPANQGRGRAYGVDFYVAKPAVSASDRFTGWGSYTWGKAQTTAYGRTYAADYDMRHSLSMVGTYALSRSLDLAGTVRVQSGFPYTAPVGVRIASVEDALDLDGDGNVSEMIPQRDNRGLLVWAADYGDVANLKAARLPLYARVDIRATYKPRWMDDRWQLYFEIINVLNRKNAGSMESTLEYDPASDRPRVVTRSGSALPLLPTVGLRFRF